jgi:MFS family permease
MGAMIFLPAGYAIAGPVADRIGISTSLWIGAAWIVVTTIAVLSVPSVRNFRSASGEGPVPARGQSEMHIDEPVGQQF